MNPASWRPGIAVGWQLLSLTINMTAGSDSPHLHPRFITLNGPPCCLHLDVCLVRSMFRDVSGEPTSRNTDHIPIKQYLAIRLVTMQITPQVYKTRIWRACFIASCLLLSELPASEANDGNDAATVSENYQALTPQSPVILTSPARLTSPDGETTELPAGVQVIFLAAEGETVRMRYRNYVRSPLPPSHPPLRWGSTLGRTEVAFPLRDLRLDH